MSDAKVTSFTVRSLLGDASRYLIPMYQRNYAWGEGEITQLVQDILDYQQKAFIAHFLKLTTSVRWSCSLALMDSQR